MPGLATGLGLAAPVQQCRLTPALQDADLQHGQVGLHVTEDADILEAVPAHSTEGDGRATNTVASEVWATPAPQLRMHHYPW